MPDSILRCKSKDFAKQVVFLCRDTKTKTKESVLTNQLLRSGTSIGANIYEAQYAQGNTIAGQEFSLPCNFIAKFYVFNAIDAASQSGFTLLTVSSNR